MQVETYPELYSCSLRQGLYLKEDPMDCNKPDTFGKHTYNIYIRYIYIGLYIF